MNAKTLKALKGSIAKWEAIVAGTGANRGADNCPLCALYTVDFLTCLDACPVKKKTGENQCRGTPYFEFRDASEDGYATTKEAKAAARAELRFLKSLLPRKP